MPTSYKMPKATSVRHVREVCLRSVFLSIRIKTFFTDLTHNLKPGINELFSIQTNWITFLKGS